MNLEFRIWDKDLKKWLPTEDGIWFDFETEYGCRRKANLSNLIKCVNAFEVQMWTGLSDKNGKKIFEGDLVESDDGVGGRMYGYVEMIDGSFCIVFTDVVQWTFKMAKNLEVVGNIFENPELL
jgi:uncharacterized phage protein (TIGR01671 family)